MRAQTTWFKPVGAISTASLAVVAVVAFSFMANLAPAMSSADAKNPILEIDAPRQVQVGKPFELVFNLKNIATIAGYEATLLFDPTVAHYHGLQQRENDLRHIGRDVAPLGALELPNGIALGFFSCLVDCIEGLGAGGNLINPQTELLGRKLKLARVLLVADQPGTLELRLDATKFVDLLGNPVTVQLENPVLTIEVGRAREPFYPAPAGLWTLPRTEGLVGPVDLTGDNLVSYPDAMEVALEWEMTRARQAPCGLDPVEPGRDVNGDGCIDVADLQSVAGRYSPLELLTSLQAQPEATASVWVVNTTTDDPDWGIGDGICSTHSGQCSLRAALLEANARPGPDTIHFNIPGSGPHTIQLGKKLPTLNDPRGPTTIDGYTQPGSSPNSHPFVSNAVIKIQVQGVGESYFDGFVVTTPGNTIRGLSILQLHRPIWVYGRGAHDNKILGNFIGTNAAASYMAPGLVNLAHGLHIEQGASYNQVGTNAVADRNVVSGNARHGIGIWHEGSRYNVIVNNIVGLSPDGTRRLPNRKHGIDLNFGTSYTTIGGGGRGTRNVISGNDDAGVEISHEAGTTQNRVEGNYIGTDASGNGQPFTYNAGIGIALEDGVSNNMIINNVIGNNLMGGIYIRHSYTTHTQITGNLIGVSSSGAPVPNSRFGVAIDGSFSRVGPNNTIAHSQYAGIKVDGDEADFNTITRNSIYQNGSHGIDLAPLGPINPNDPGDVDSGPNEQLNFPELTEATPTLVRGTACGGCTIEVFVADGSADHYGEGQRFVGSATANSNGTFAVAITGVVAGDIVTTTATDAAGNTSEFSPNRRVSP